MKHNVTPNMQGGVDEATPPTLLTTAECLVRTYVVSVQLSLAFIFLQEKHLVKRYNESQWIRSAA